MWWLLVSLLAGVTAFVLFPRGLGALAHAFVSPHLGEKDSFSIGSISFRGLHELKLRLDHVQVPGMGVTASLLVKVAAVRLRLCGTVSKPLGIAVEGVAVAVRIKAVHPPPRKPSLGEGLPPVPAWVLRYVTVLVANLGVRVQMGRSVVHLDEMGLAVRTSMGGKRVRAQLSGARVFLDSVPESTVRVLPAEVGVDVSSSAVTVAADGVEVNAAPDELLGAVEAALRDFAPLATVPLPDIPVPAQGKVTASIARLSFCIVSAGDDTLCLDVRDAEGVFSLVRDGGGYDWQLKAKGPNARLARMANVPLLHTDYCSVTCTGGQGPFDRHRFSVVVFEPKVNVSPALPPWSQLLMRLIPKGGAGHTDVSSPLQGDEEEKQLLEGKTKNKKKKGQHRRHTSSASSRTSSVLGDIKVLKCSVGVMADEEGERSLCVLALSELTCSVEQSSFTIQTQDVNVDLCLPSSIAAHEMKMQRDMGVFRTPGRFLRIEHGSVRVVNEFGMPPDVRVTCRGVKLKWSVWIMRTAAPVTGLIAAMLPPSHDDPQRPARAQSSSSSSSSSSSEEGNDHKLSSPMRKEQKTTKKPVVCSIEVHDTTVDFPYCLELGDRFVDPANMTDSDEDSGDEKKHEHDDDDEDDEEEEEEELPTEGAMHLSRTRSFFNAPDEAMALNMTLKRYRCGHASITIFGPSPCAEKGSHSISLNANRAYNNGVEFLQVDTFNIDGANAFRDRPRTFFITSDGVRGEWDPALQLGLFKLIKDIVASVINLKADMFPLLYDVAKATRERVAALERCTASAFYDGRLRDKEAFARAFKQWYYHDRAIYLPESFLHVTMDATNIHIRASVGGESSATTTTTATTAAAAARPPMLTPETSSSLSELVLDVRVGVFKSSNIPHQWTFRNVDVAYCEKPLVSVLDFEMTRIGISPEVVDGAYTEAKHLLGEYLDFDIAITGVKLENAPDDKAAVPFGVAVHQINLHVQALVQAILSLPTLDTLSRRYDGPGYCGPPSKPPPGVTLHMRDIDMVMVDSPLESWLQHVQRVWRKEAVEQEWREEMCKIKLNTLVDHTDEQKEARLRQHWELNSSMYRRHIAELRTDVAAAGFSLKKAPLCRACVDHIDVEIRLSGEHGALYAGSNVLSNIKRINRQPGGSGDNEETQRGGDDEAHDDDDDPTERLDFYSLLAGRYFSVSVRGMSLHLRNFPLPVFSAESLRLTGTFLVSQRKGGAVTDITARSVVSIGMLHRVVVKRSMFPFELTYEIDGDVEAPEISFSPGYLYALRDSVFAIAKVLPPMLDPRESNHWHLIKALSNSNVAMEINRTKIRLLASADPFQVDDFLEVCAQNTYFAFDSSVANFQTQRMTIMQRPSEPEQPYLMEVPHVNIFTNIVWACVGGDLDHRCALSLALSVHLPQREDDPHVSVALHSGTLTSLIRLGQVYVAMPPLPFPRRAPIAFLRHRRVVPVLSKMGEEDAFSSPSLSSLQLYKKPTIAQRRHLRDLSVESASAMVPTDVVLVGSPTSGKRSLLPASQSTDGQASSSSMGEEVNEADLVTPLSLVGLFIERVAVEGIRLTVWEGAHRGPARGLAIGVKLFYFSAELHEEAPGTEEKAGRIAAQAEQADADNASMDEDGKIFFKPFAAAASISAAAATSAGPLLEGVAEGDESEDCDDEPEEEEEKKRDEQQVARVQDVRQRQQQQTQTQWSIANVVCGVEGIRASLAFNKQWMDLVQLDVNHALEGVTGNDRVVVHVYENQRYTLGFGWSHKNLLPTDRPAWSNQDGSQRIDKENVMLPSGWCWEADWQLDFQLRQAGEVDEEGWEYANDFPRRYASRRRWYHNVRRRRWIRVRTLAADGDASMGSPVSVRAPSPMRQQQRQQQQELFVMSLSRAVFEQQRPEWDPSEAQSHRDTFIMTLRTRFFFQEGRKRRDSVIVKSASLPHLEHADEKTLALQREKAQMEQRQRSRLKSDVSSLLSHFRIGEDTNNGSGNDDVHGNGLSAPPVPPRKGAAALASSNGGDDDDDEKNKNKNKKKKQKKAAAQPARVAAIDDAVGRMQGVRVHRMSVREPKVLLTLETRNALVVIADSYVNTITELLIEAEVKDVRGGGDKDEHENNNDGTRRRHRTLSGSEDDDADTLNDLLSMFPPDDSDEDDEEEFLSDVEGHLGTPPRLRRARRRRKSTNDEDEEEDEEESDDDDEEEEDDSKAFKPITRVLSTAPSTVLVESGDHVRVRDLFSVEIVQPQINIESEDTSSCVLFSVSECTVEGRVHSTMDDDDDEGGPQKVEVNLVVSDGRVYVAPTDVDVNSGTTWLGSSREAVLKPIVQPVPVLCTFVYLPDAGEDELHQVTVQMPLLHAAMDAEQCGMLLGVLRTVLMAPLPTRIEETDGGDDVLEDIEGDKSVVQVKKERTRLEWEMRHTEWLMSGLRRQDIRDTVNDLPSFAAMSELDELEATLAEIMTKYARVSATFASRLRELKAREAVDYRPRVRNVHAECYVENVNVDLLKNARPFFRVAVSGIVASATAHKDFTAELTLEVRHLSATHPGQGEWSEVVAPLVYGNRVWGHNHVMVAVRASKRHVMADDSILVPHLEVNVYPLNVKLTYELIVELAGFFVADAAAEAKHHQKRKRKFLPAVPTILHIPEEAHRRTPYYAGRHLTSATASSPRRDLSQSPSPRAGSIDEEPDDKVRLARAIKDRRLLHVALELFQERQRELELEAETRKLDKGRKKRRRKENAQLVNPWLRELRFVYVRLGSTRIVVSYKGNRQHNIENFRGLKIKFKQHVYQKKSWKVHKFLGRLRRDVVKNLLSQVGDAFGAFVSYKLGWRSHMLRRSKNDDARAGTLFEQFGGRVSSVTSEEREISRMSEITRRSSGDDGDDGWAGEEEEEEKRRQLLLGKKSKKKEATKAKSFFGGGKTVVALSYRVEEEEEEAEEEKEEEDEEDDGMFADRPPVLPPKPTSSNK